MVLDKEEHRVFLLQVLDQGTFGGGLRKLLAEVGEAIEKAEVRTPEPSDG